MRRESGARDRVAREVVAGDGCLPRAAAFLAALSVCVSIAGCVEHRRLVAYRTLFNEDGQIDAAAYSAALQARFPPGTPVARLESYVRSARGSCGPGTATSLQCQLVINGTICIAHTIAIEAGVSDGSIEHVRAVARYQYC